MDGGAGVCGCIQQCPACNACVCVCARACGCVCEYSPCLRAPPPNHQQPPPLHKHTSEHTKVCAGVWNNNNSNSHSCSLRRNVEGVKLEFAHCLTLEAVHCFSLRMQCETVISRVFEALFQTHLIFMACASSESSGSRANISITPPGYKSL